MSTRPNSKKDLEVHVPPRWATNFLRWYCRSEMAEDLEGDLHEYFIKNCEKSGVRRAKLIYILDVLKFLRPYTIRQPQVLHHLTNWFMLQSYVKTSARNIARNKLFSTINIAGLAVSMLVGLIVISIVAEILSYDKFHDNHERIYRVTSHYQYLDHKDNSPMATTSVKAGRSIQDEFAGHEKVTIINNRLSGDVKAGETIVPLTGLWVDPNFFEIFSFRLLEGDKATSLNEPFSILLTDVSMKNLFGDKSALGKVVSMSGYDYTVTGIVQSPPRQSHMRFDMLVSYNTRERQRTFDYSKDSLDTEKVAQLKKEKSYEMSWENIWNTYVYVLMPAHADLQTFKQNLDKLSKREDPTIKNTHIELNLQAMDDIMLGEDHGNQIGPVMGSSSLWVFGSLAFVVILSACFNYTNLSIARSLRRTRDVGIRKVMGAMKGQVAGQFLVEAVIIALSALAVAFVLFIFARPYFLTFNQDFQRLITLDLTPEVVIFFLLFAIVVGLAAGTFPALFFAKVNTINVLKNFAAVTIGGRLTMRKALIVMQYMISLIFISSTLVVYRQFNHFIAFDLGYSTENIINISLQGNKPDLVRKAVSELPEVKAISQSAIVTSVGNYWGARIMYPGSPLDSGVVNYNFVDENYLPLHDHQLLTGMNFTAKAPNAVEDEVIVNEKVLKRFNIAKGDPQKALGEVVRIDRMEMKIVGVMKDFSYGRASDRNEQKEICFRYSPKECQILNVKVESNDLVGTQAKLEAAWKKIDPVHPYEAQFYTDELENAFRELKAAVRMAGSLAFLAICIASLGLLGMVVFSTETRLKEVSIRKVMGASDGTLLFLLGKGFVLLLGLAALIALPLTVAFFEALVLPELPNHAPWSFIELALGVVFVLGIAVVMIFTQAFKVARTNPAEVLKTE